MGAIGRFLAATAAGAGLGAGAALARRRHLAAHAAQPSAPVGWETPPTGTVPHAGGVDPAPAMEPTDVADLEAARARLRQRAAELRAEMEGSPSHG